MSWSTLVDVFKQIVDDLEQIVDDFKHKSTGSHQLGHEVEQEAEATG